MTTTPSYSGITVAVAGDAAGPEINTTNGMRGATTGTTTASGYYLTGWPAGLDTAGQMSFEISAAYLMQNSGQLGGSAGDILAASACAISWQNGDNANNGQIGLCYRGSGSGGAVGFRRLFSVIDTNHWFVGWAARTANSGRYHSFGKPSDGFVRVNIGWYDDGTRRVVMAVDGVVVQTMTRDDTSSPFTSLCLGGRANTFFGFQGFLENFTGLAHWIRNLQISTLAPTVPTLTTTALESIAIMSDSIINAATPENTAFGDLNYDVRIFKALEARLVRPTTVYRMSAGGHLMTELADGATTYSFTAGNTATQVATDSTTAADVRGRVKGRNCRILIINGGSNDVSTSAVTPTLFRDAIRDHLCYFLGLNGTSWGGADYSASPPAVAIERIFLTNIVDRGMSWDNYTGCALTSGSPTVTVIGDQSIYRNGDEVADLAGTYLPAGVTILSGGGTSTLTLSANALASGNPINVHNRTTYATSALRAKAALLRQEIEGIPAWFAATYPSATCTVAVLDIFTGMGGVTRFTGKIGSDEVHPGYAGVCLIGDTIGAALAAIA